MQEGCKEIRKEGAPLMAEKRFSWIWAKGTESC